MNTSFSGLEGLHHLSDNAAHSIDCPLPPCTVLQILAIPQSIAAVCALIMTTNDSHLNALSYAIKVKEQETSHAA